MSQKIEKQIYFGSKDELEQLENSKKIYFSDCFNFKKTYSYPRDYEVNFSNLHHVHYGDIHTKFPNTITKDIALPHIKNEKQNYVTLLPGDIVVADASEDHKDLGKSVLFTDAERSVIAGLHTHFLRNNNNIIDSKYYLYFTKTDTYIREMRRLGTGISVLGISKTNLSKIKIPYESLENQKKIAATLSQIDNLISLSNRKINKLLMTKTMYSNMIFTIKNMREWNLDKLENLYEISNTGVDKKINSAHAEVNLLNYMDVYKKTIYTNHLVTATNNELANCIVQKGDLFITPSSETAQDIMNAFAIKENLDNYVYSYHICRLRGSFIHSIFAEYYFNSNFARNQFSKLATGATRFTISKTELMKYSMYFPSEEIQENIATTLSQMDKLIEIEEKKLEQLEKMKKYHLQQFFN